MHAALPTARQKEHIEAPSSTTIDRHAAFHGLRPS